VLPDFVRLPLSKVVPGLAELFCDVVQFTCTGAVELVVTTTLNEPSTVSGPLTQLTLPLVPLVPLSAGLETVTLLTWLGDGGGDDDDCDGGGDGCGWGDGGEDGAGVGAGVLLAAAAVAGTVMVTVAPAGCRSAVVWWCFSA
jgi:hypothetical protein